MTSEPQQLLNDLILESTRPVIRLAWANFCRHHMDASARRRSKFQSVMVQYCIPAALDDPPDGADHEDYKRRVPIAMRYSIERVMREITAEERQVSP